MLNEADIIKGIIQGDEKDFKALYQAYAGRVYNTALSILQHRQEAEDITQEVFIGVYNGVANFKFNASVQTWIYSITVNKCYAHLKKQQTKKRFALFTSLFNDDLMLQHDKPHFEHPGVILENKEQAKVLFNALNNIAPNQKIAFTLAKIEGLSYRDAAAAMKISPSAFESLMLRALKNLKSCISDYYKNNDKASEGKLPIWLLT